MRTRSRNDGLPFPDRAAAMVASIMSGHPGEPVAAVAGLIKGVKVFSAYFGSEKRRSIADQLRSAADHIEHLDEDQS